MSSITATSTPRGTGSANNAPRRRRARPTTRQWAGLWFVTPFLIVFAVAFLAPVIYSIILSFYKHKLIGGNVFVGFENYIQAFTDPKLLEGGLRVGLFLIIQVPIMLILAMCAAMALDSKRLAGEKFFRIGIFLPYAVPGVVAVLMWGFLYSERMGLAGNVNDFLGFDLITPYTSHWILVSIGNIVTWEFVGYNMLIFYSALRAIPEDLYEAAALDGAGQFRIIWSIKLPALRGPIVIATIFSIIGSFQLFNEPNILRPLAPGQITTYFTPNMYAYNLSFFGQQINYAATVAIIMGIVTAVIAYVVQLRGNKQELR